MGARGESSTEGVAKKITVIVYNKYILDKNMYNWPYPISLAMIHMSFCSSMAFLLVRFKFVEPVSNALYLKSVIPIGALYALSLWFSNSAYIFIQMLKALMPVAVYSIGSVQKGMLQIRDNGEYAVYLVGSIAAYGEAKDVRGVTLQLGAVALEATRLVMIQILLTSGVISLNPFNSVYYVAPCCTVFLFVPWVFVEYPLLRDSF